MDAEGGCVVHRDRRTSKLAVVVAVQNMVVTACLLVTLYVYWDVKVKLEQTPVSDQDVHIQFDTIADIPGGQKLKFGSIANNSIMNLTDDTKSKIWVPCPGPYILYMDICYRSTGAFNGTLELQVEGNETPLSTFKLHTSNTDCRGLHSTVYLRKDDQAFLYLNSSNDFKIKTVTVGFRYMLAPCEL